MNNKRLEMLYRTIIKEHSQEPSNQGHLEQQSGEFELFNPSCGDLVTVQFLLKEDIITDIRFNGHGCAISIASASLMTELMIGKTIKESEELIKLFSQLVQGEENLYTDPLKDAVFLQGVSQFPMRIRCATLAWHALQNGLENVK